MCWNKAQSILDINTIVNFVNNISHNGYHLFIKCLNEKGEFLEMFTYNQIFTFYLLFRCFYGIGEPHGELIFDQNFFFLMIIGELYEKLITDLGFFLLIKRKFS